MAHWQTRPVFVSSTFRDMQSERDWLRDHVIPELEERLRARRARLEAVDLRWGVETVGAGEEQAKEMIVLKVCLEEIRRCRPFLIVLLGDRYGWVPAPERMKAAVDEAGFETEIEGKSVTALEIEFGVLASPDQRRRTRFYFREPLPYGEMPPDVAAQFSEAHSTKEGAAQAHERLQALKQRIETDPTWRDRVRHYSAQWDPTIGESGRVTGLDEFGAMVLEDVWADLEAEIPPLEQQAEVTWQDEERAAFEEFVAHRDRDFRGRAEITDELVDFAMGEGGEWALSLTGGSGSGKSALLAHVYRGLEERAVEHRTPGPQRRGLLSRLGIGRRHEPVPEGKTLLLAHAAGISGRSTSVDGLLLRFIGELAGFLGEEVPVEEDASAEDIEQAFASLLGRAARRTRVVVLVDALNQFEPTPRAQHLTWLPKLWPHNARLITTAIPCSASEALERRDGVRARDLPALTTPEAKDIAKAVCDRYHRTLNPDVLQVLLDKRNSAGEPSSGNPLWLELALEALNLLDQDDFERLGRDFTGTGEERLLKLLLDVAGKLPGDIEELYGWLLSESEETWGEAWAREFACLIAVSRGGWRESDFEKLLPARTGEAWDPLRFAGLRRSFRAHLARRGPQRQWDFFHAQARAAVRRRYLTDPARERDVHAALADHLEALPDDDPLHETELMFHLIGADDKLRAALYYGDRSLTDAELAGATARLAEHIIATAGEDTGPGLEWAMGLLEQPVPDDVLAWLCGQRYLSDVYDGLANRAQPRTKLRLLHAARKTAEAQARKHRGRAEWQRHLAVSHGATGDVLRVLGDLSGALAAYQASLEISKRMETAHPGSAGWWQHDLSVNHGQIGAALAAQGDLAGALQAYRRSYTALERLAAADPENPSRQHDLAATQIKIGEVLQAKGDLAGALQSYAASCETLQCAPMDHPGTAGWQRDLAVSHDKIGDVRAAQGDFSGASRAYKTSLQTRERLARSDPGNIEWQRDLAVSHIKIGDTERGQGRFPHALQSYRASHDLLGPLAREYPTNTTCQYDLAISHERIGATLLAQGHAAEALQQFRAKHAIIRALASADADNAEWQRDLSVSHVKMGDAHRAQGDLSDALRAYEAAHDVLKRLALPHPENALWQRDLSVSHFRLAQIASETRDAMGQARHLMQCREILRGMKARGMHLDPQAAAVLEQLEGLG